MQNASRPLPSVPLETCVYAIGDIHGRLDLLRTLIAKITTDASSLPTNVRKYLVFLGDYIDRGQDSKGVLDYFITSLPHNFTPVFVRGNHEDVLLHFLDSDFSVVPSWLKYGGVACLASYGVDAYRAGITAQETTLQKELKEKLPPAHEQFLRKTIMRYDIGDYCFVHAGVNPELPLDKQNENDLLWIRTPFLTSTQDFGKVVVHGHTISNEPELLHNRIGIDTGAYASGTLTAVRLYGTAQDILST